MPTLSQAKQWLTLTAVPVLAGALSNWLVVHLHFLAAFHANAGTVTAELTQLGVFGVSAGLAFLASHHILKGTYAPDLHALLPLAQPILGELKTPPAPAPVTVNIHPGVPATPDVSAQVAEALKTVFPPAPAPAAAADLSKVPWSITTKPPVAPAASAPVPETPPSPAAVPAVPPAA